MATEERPGPVHLELPEDIAGEMGPAVPMVPPHTIELPVAAATAVDRAAAMIRQAHRPLVMLGAAASRPRLGADLGEFLARTRIPFFTTQMGKGVVAGRPLRAARRPVAGHRRPLRARLRARGHRPGRPDPGDRARHGGEAAVLHGPGRTDGHPRRLHPAQRRGGLLPARLGRRRHRPEPVACSPTGWRATCPTPRRCCRCATASCGTSRTEPTTTASRSCRNASSPTCATVMPPDGIVALDNGMYKIWFARNYRTPVSNTLLLDNALATMGAGLPSAMMAALIHPDRRVLAVCGDGGFMMNSQELETAVRLGLNLVVLILQDDAYGMIRWKQAVDKFPDFGMTFGNPDFVAYAQAYGAQGIPGARPPRTSSRSCSRRSSAAASTSWSLRSTTPRTPGSSSTSSATACRLPPKRKTRRGRTAWIRQRSPRSPLTQPHPSRHPMHTSDPAGTGDPTDDRRSDDRNDHRPARGRSAGRRAEPAAHRRPLARLLERSDAPGRGPGHRRALCTSPTPPPRTATAALDGRGGRAGRLGGHGPARARRDPAPGLRADRRRSRRPRPADDPGDGQAAGRVARRDRSTPPSSSAGSPRRPSASTAGTPPPPTAAPAC